MSLTLPVSEGFDLVPADIYEAKYTGYTELTTDYGPAIKMHFQIINNVDYKDAIVTGLASIPANGLTPKSKLRGWIEGMVGRKLAGVTDDVELDKLIGRTCRLNLSIVAKGDREYNRIDSILPLKSAAKATPTVDVDETLGF